ncbi:MAG: cysteine desulfurase [Clostridia bacterium]|nr:cysteine desulfurase [Clostridia bacterium]
MNVYLDHAATTPLAEEVLDAMLPYLKEEYGNPDSPHAYGRRAAYAVSEARDRVAQTLGVLPQEVYFTSGGTEADNWAVRDLGQGRAVVSAIEHSAVLEGSKLRADGVCVLPVAQNGCVEVARAAELLDGAGLLCVMAVNNETGCIQPVEELGALCKARGVLFFSDCVQAAGSLDLKRIASACDAFSVSAHKVYGPKGVGALVVKKGVALRPLVAGGEQERGLRGGTLNVAGIVGFSVALERSQAMREEWQTKLARLRDRFEKDVLSVLGDEVRVNGENRVAGISHMTFRRGGTAFLNKLDLHGVACSGGAACTAHSALPSHVLMAMGRSEDEAKRGARFSFGAHTTEADIDFAVRTITDCYGKK